MDNKSTKDSIAFKLRQMEDENETLKNRLVRKDSYIQQLERDNRRMQTVLNHIHGMTGTENNSPSCSGFVVADSAGQVNRPNTADQSTQEVETYEDPTQNQKSECEPLKFERVEKRSWCEERKRELKNINDERRLRHYLCRAISKNARKFAMELDVLHLIDQLLSRDCITEDEYRSLRSLGDSTNLARVILPLVLRRDCRTLLSFIDILFERDTHLTKFITQEYDNLVQEDCSGDVTGPNCSHCLLVQRVEPILIIDFLISLDYSKWLPFYEQVVNCKDDVPEKRKTWWDDFITHVIKDGASADMNSVIIQALEVCGFHSDIVESLHDDQNNNINSFMCQLINRSAEDVTSNQGASYINEPRMQVLKEVDDENTNLKMIANTTQSSTMPTGEHKMLELKLFDSESDVKPEYPDESSQGQDENTNATGHNQHENVLFSIFFISNSDITITNKNS